MSELIECIDGLTANQIFRRIAKTANGQPFYLQTLGLAGFCAEYQVVYDALTTPPSDAIATAQNTMVCGLVDDGIWAKLDLFYLFAQEFNTANEADINWVNPATFTVQRVNNPGWVSLEGYTGNASNMYLNTQYDPENNGVNFTLNSASVGVYIRTNIQAADVDIGCYEAPPANTDAIQIYTRYTGDLAIIRLNTVSNSSGANADSRGMFILTRVTGVAEQDLWRNKVRIINGTLRPAIGLCDQDIYILASNNDGLPGFHSANQVSMAFAGGGLTQTDINNLTDRVETYMDSNGKGVIS